VRRRTKIVCTIGPATASAEAVLGLVEAGMDVARLNFSHGTHESHAETVAWVRAAAEATGHSVGVLADLQGPKIRLGRFQGGTAILREGATFVMSAEPLEEGGTCERGSVTYEALARDLSPGDTLLIDDGTVKLKALSTDGRQVSCQVLEGGPLCDAKGVNLPGAQLSVGALTEKDIDDLHFALDVGADVIALSFVRRAEDAVAVRRLMDEAGRSVPLIAKIERPEAVADLGAVLDAFDGVMVARGDLGVEMPLEQVPVVQKRAVQAARERGKPAIVATQMLESMTHNRRPTRAEVSDVANAVLDGADALMLAGETGVGEYPAETVAMMARIVSAVEDDCLSGIPALSGEAAVATQLSAVASAAVAVADEMGAQALVAFTETGQTARSLARHRSTVPLVALTPYAGVRRQLALSWDVDAVLSPPVVSVEEELRLVDRAVLARGGQVGDRAVVVAGRRGQSGSTHTLRVHQVEAL
jgi:pyruvate kinase